MIILVCDYLTNFLRNRTFWEHCKLHTIFREVVRPLVNSIKGFFVEFLILLGTIHECGGQLDGVHYYQAIDYEGHYCTRVSCES